jgi:uncharacterized membrane protein
MLQKTIELWQKKPGLTKVIILGTIFFTLILAISLNRYYSFYYTYDHGLFDQVFWNSVHGKLFQSSLSSAASSASLMDQLPSSPNYIHLGQHFVIDFILWMPLYALFPSPITLIVLQVALITISGIVLYALARHYLSPAISVMIVASFYGANAVIGPTLGNFYEHCQLPLFLFSLFLALEKRCWWLFWLFAILTLGIREDTGITLFGIGVYLVISRRHPRVGLILSALSFGYVVLVTNTIMPMFSNDNSRLYLSQYFSMFIKTDHPSTLQLLWAIVSQPNIIIEVFFSNLDRRLKYIFGLWLPLGFVPALSIPAWIMTSFPLLIILLQDANRAATSINTRYTLSIVPVLIYGVILWWSQHSEKFKPRPHRFWIGCIVLSILFTLNSNPGRALYFLVPNHIQPWVYQSLNGQWQRAAHIQTVLNSIPKDASVSTTSDIVSHLSQRRNLIRLPSMKIRNEAGTIVDVDYGVVDIGQLLKSREIVPIDRERVKASVRLIDDALTQGNYGIAKMVNGIVLIQKGVNSQPEALSAWLKLRKEVQPFLNLSKPKLS